MLEGLLEEQGLAVPPATHPPETRHGSRRSDETLSVDYTATSSSTPQDSTSSENHTASSPSNSDDQVKDERSATGPRRRSSINLETNFAGDRYIKRTKSDSLIMPANIKAESPMQDHLNEITRLSEACELDRFVMPPPLNPASLWATVHDQISVQSATHSKLHTLRTDNYAHDIWGDKSWDLQNYDPYLMDSQHRDLFHVERHYTDIRSTAGGITNLDFMPLSVNS
jgi:hypothetical protein